MWSLGKNAYLTKVVTFFLVLGDFHQLPLSCKGNQYVNVGVGEIPHNQVENLIKGRFSPSGGFPHTDKQNQLPRLKSEGAQKGHKFYGNQNKKCLLDQSGQVSEMGSEFEKQSDQSGHLFP